MQGQAKQRWVKLCKKAANQLAREIALLLDEKAASTPGGKHARAFQRNLPNLTPKKSPCR